MANSFGHLFRITTWGESHGGGVGVVVDGCPPRLKLTAGVRVADVKFDATEYSSGALNAGVPPVYSGASRETPVTPKAGASFQYDENNLFYTYIAKGYRVGGVNTPLPSFCSGPTAPASYNSDSVWSYEIGAKDNLFDGRLQLDTSVYHINWNNIQQEVLVLMQVGNILCAISLVVL